MKDPKTAADKLLVQFDRDEDSFYVALYAEYSSDKLTINSISTFTGTRMRGDGGFPVCSKGILATLGI